MAIGDYQEHRAKPEDSRAEKGRRRDRVATSPARLCAFLYTANTEKKVSERRRGRPAIVVRTAVAKLAAAL